MDKAKSYEVGPEPFVGEKGCRDKVISGMNGHTPTVVIKGGPQPIWKREAHGVISITRNFVGAPSELESGLVSNTIVTTSSMSLVVGTLPEP